MQSENLKKPGTLVGTLKDIHRSFLLRVNHHKAAHGCNVKETRFSDGSAFKDVFLELNPSFR